MDPIFDLNVASSPVTHRPFLRSEGHGHMVNILLCVLPLPVLISHWHLCW